MIHLDKVWEQAKLIHACYNSEKWFALGGRYCFERGTRELFVVMEML